MAAIRKFLSSTKNKMTNASSRSKHGSSQNAVDEEFERRKQQWQKDLEEMSDFLVIKSSEEQRAEGVECPLDTAFIDDRDGLPVLKAAFDIHHFRPDDVTLTVENTSGEDDGDGVRRQLVLFAQLTDDSRECSLFKKTMLRRVDLPDFVETRWMFCRLEPTPSSLQSRLTIELPFHLTDPRLPPQTSRGELPFHLPPQRRPKPGPGIVPILTDVNGRRLIRFTVPIGPDFTLDDISVEVDADARQVLVSALYEAEIGHYGMEVTQRRLRRVFRLPDGSLQWDSVHHTLDDDGRLHVEIQLKPAQPFKCDLTTEELQIVNDVMDDVSSTLNDADDNSEILAPQTSGSSNDLTHE